MLPYAPKLVTPPAVEPVTLAEAKRHANVVASDEDSLITALIVTARELIESETSRALITQSWAVTLQEWFTDHVELPRPPLQSVTSLKYLDADGVERTLASGQYLVDTHREPGVIWRKSTTIWPVLLDQANPITITYKAGYGDAAASVPARAKQAILLLVGHWYLNREAVGRAEGEIAITVDRLVRCLRVGVYP